MARRGSDFQTLRSEGGLLPADLLRRVIDPKEKLAGTQPQDYGLPLGDRLNEAITQSWSRLLRHWAEFRTAAAGLPSGEPGTGLTNDKWSLPLLRELGFGMLPTTAGPELGGRRYAITRFSGPVPIHLVGCGVSLDRRAAGVRGAASVNPHGLVQEFLNRSPGHLWAIVSNGLTLRVLRDNQALSRQSYLEFDIEAMFTGEVYSDFVLLWLMAHASRLAPRQDGRPESCWLEEWTKLAEEQGTRALGDLRIGVQDALQILGEGFTSHPRNTALRDGLRAGEIQLTDFHGQLLRVVYRLIFLFVAEDRTLDGASVLHPPLPTASVSEGGLQYQMPAPDLAQVAEPRAVYTPGSSGATVQARARYAAHYSTARLREQASRIKGSRHGDLWRQFQIIVGALSGDAAHETTREALALPALGSYLWDPASTADLNGAELSNFVFLDSVRHLAFTRSGKTLRPVDYRNLGAEELGGVYEGLLALTPQIGADGARFTFAELAGNERKTSGSYYTPDSLVQCLLDSALDPVVEEAIKGKTGAEAENALLALKVCDPAVGSGHFLVGAAHRLARHLARVRAAAQGESEPSPLLYQHALRDVIGRCLYGVDINPMAAELCRVSLWLEALEPGKPLSFLDHHIRVGNSLLGATPELIAAGIPDEAFTAIEGDDKLACTALRNRNKGERVTLSTPLFAQEGKATQERLQHAAAALDVLPDDRPEHVRAKERAFRLHEQTEEYQGKKQVADAWCAAFMMPKYFTEPGRESSVHGLTHRHLLALVAGQQLPPDLAAEVVALATQFQLFHWHLAFPEVFAKGGFDCILGNPPWEHIELKEQEWFAGIDAIASAGTASKRKELIQRLADSDPELHDRYLRALRHFAAVTHLLRRSGGYMRTATGRINTYAVFAELSTRITATPGRIGCIWPSGLATDDNTNEFFRWLLAAGRIVSLFEFENEGFFTAGHGHMLRFGLTTLAGRDGAAPSAEFAFQGKSIADISRPERRFRLSAADLELVNPNTASCPIFLSRHDADVVLRIHAHVPIAICETTGTNPWGLSTRQGLFNMASASGLFRTAADFLGCDGIRVGTTYRDGATEYVRLIESKMMSIFNHRHGDFDDAENGARAHRLPRVAESRLIDPEYEPSSFYWVPRDEVEARVDGGWRATWLLCWRDVADGRASARGLVATAVPREGVGHTLAILYSSRPDAYLLAGNLAAFALDFVARQKIGGLHLTGPIFRQLPLVPPEAYAATPPWLGCSIHDWVASRTAELVATSWSMVDFGRAACGSQRPFRWDSSRRELLRAELDALYFHLYGYERRDVEHAMDSFDVLGRNEVSEFGEFRSRRTVLAIYDELAEASRTGSPYRTRLDPPPADPRVAHPNTRQPRGEERR